MTIALEGTRPLAVEIQALVAPSGSGSPRRATTGIDVNRVLMLIAVLARHAGVNLAGHDVYVNVAGGLRIEEPAADLAIAVALASSLRERPVRAARSSPARSRCRDGCAPPSAPSGALPEATRLGFDRLVTGPRAEPRPERRADSWWRVTSGSHRSVADGSTAALRRTERGARSGRCPVHGRHGTQVLRCGRAGTGRGPTVSSRLHPVHPRAAASIHSDSSFMTRIIQLPGALLGTLIGFALGLALLQRAGGDGARPTGLPS